MFNKNALRGFAVGVLAAIIVALGFLPVLASDSHQLLPKNHKLAPYINGSPVGSPDEEELDRVGAADKVTEQGFGGSSPLVIPAAAFRNDGDDPDGYFFYPWGGYIRGKDPATDAACMMAPAYLPHGATVTRVCAYLYDNDSSYDAYAELQRVRNASAEQETMASVSTSGTGAGIQFLCDETISPNEVDNLYSYYVTTCLYSTTTRLWAVRIFYAGQAKTYLPIILKGYCSCGPDNYEPNDSFAQAYGPLISGQTYQSYISCCDVASRKDYFYIDISTTNPINIDLTNIPTGVDYDLYLYNSAQVEVRRSQKDGNLPEHISYNPPSAGRYYILVFSPFGHYSTSPYSLRVIYD